MVRPGVQPGAGGGDLRLSCVVTRTGPRSPRLTRCQQSGHLRTADPLSSPGVPIAFRLFRSDPVEGLLMTWGDAMWVSADQTELDLQIAGQEPGSYRLVAYHAMTEPLAVLDLTIEGDPSLLPTPPALPAGWQRVASGDGGLVLALPAVNSRRGDRR